MSLIHIPGIDDKPGSKNPVGGIVFKEIFDTESPSTSQFFVYADWFIRRNIRNVAAYSKEPVSV